MMKVDPPNPITENNRDTESQPHEDKYLLGLEFVEAKATSDRASVAVGANNAGNEPCDWWVDAGDNTVQQALDGLDKGGEDDHDEDGEAEALGVGQDEDHAVLNNKDFEDYEVGDQAHTHGQDEYSQPYLIG